MFNNYFIDYNDYCLDKILKLELSRQKECINLIASENYASKLVMQLQGSCLTNKYAEGYPNKRYYGGCKYIDTIEKLAIHRAKNLFNADYANVQPHSGSQANFAVYSALLKTGDTILGMKLSHGGHLTHGSKINLSGMIYKSIFYELDNSGNINYYQLEKLASKYKPKIIIGGFSSYSGMIDWKKMRIIADQVNAYLVADIAHVAGLVVTNLYPNPINYAHVVTTTTHKTLAGPRGGLILSKNGDDNFYKKLDHGVFPCTQGGPLMHVIAAKAAALKEAMQLPFKLYQKQILLNTKAMVKIFILNKFKIVSTNISNHLFVIDLTSVNLSGIEATKLLDSVNITVNKNIIPNDKNGANITSGIRIGTAAVTRRGFKENDVCNVANWICKILLNINDKKLFYNIKNKVFSLCEKYPIYKIVCS
ncbi:MAG: serine hydroxymethyltransferase [Candidatus Lightella neohaematopini]|nr:serine hydroxymethyltransferase [Candidatus Lightella neohaematopini]